MRLNCSLWQPWVVGIVLLWVFLFEEHFEVWVLGFVDSLTNLFVRFVILWKRTVRKFLSTFCHVLLEGLVWTTHIWGRIDFFSSTFTFFFAQLRLLFLFTLFLGPRRVWKLLLSLRRRRFPRLKYFVVRFLKFVSIYWTFFVLLVNLADIWRFCFFKRTYRMVRVVVLKNEFRCLRAFFRLFFTMGIIWDLTDILWYFLFFVFFQYLFLSRFPSSLWCISA